MTHRERYVRTLTFAEKPDRIHYAFGNPRRSTIEAWYLQGLARMSPCPSDCGSPPEFGAFVGNDPVEKLSIDTDVYPEFEIRVLEADEHHRVWIDEMGVMMEDAGANLTTPGFRTRRYLAHPVRTREDWTRLRDERLDPHADGRYPDDWARTVEALKAGDVPVLTVAPGLYWKARDWVGFENLSVIFYDDPSLVGEMMEHRAWFIIELCDRMLSDVDVDCVMINEDMCYKHAMMISPRTFREFMLPHYKKMADFFRSKAVPVLAADSDGHVSDLIPLLIEAGFNCVGPMEIAANNDPIAYRSWYGRDMAFWGGVDKREITTKDRVYKEVMSKVPALLDSGGYQPGVDHGVPPTCHLRGYLYMTEIIKAVFEGRPVPDPNDPLAMEEDLGPIQRMWTPEE